MIAQRKNLSQNKSEFRELVWQFYREHERSMPWRDEPTPYYVLVSEIMLQQTQVSRALIKFEMFINRFPGFSELAHAPLGDVLREWNGLGYNRRAKYLHEAAKAVMDNGGELPASYDQLIKLPGIGANTAGAILNYAFDIPTAYVETNIRTVYLHHFFADSDELVSDRELQVLVEDTMDREHPREWFWALMDYGSYLKKTSGGRLSQSKHYKKQTALKGSQREMRGWIIQRLSVAPVADSELRTAFKHDHRYLTALQALQKEGMIEQAARKWRLTGHQDTS